MTQLNPYQAPQANLDVQYDDDAELASRGRRLGAVALDSLYLGVAPGILAAVLVPLFSRRFGSSSTALLIMAVVFGLVFIGAWVLNIISVVRTRQTLGKRQMGIKVVRTDGSEVSLGRLIIRRNLALMAVVWLVNLATFGFGSLISLIDSLAIFRESQQCVHDQIADTKVIRV
ncbi:RDD family protein [Amantichitinum ursilacus]|nr:RDD family protein [Amantichitinum ursilacus]